MVYLPDRHDHHQRLLPHVLSFIKDDIHIIREAVLDCIKRCGLLFECKHHEDIIELGNDNNYGSGLPESFPVRPSLYARLFV